MNSEAVIARLEQYKADFEIQAHFGAKDMLCQQMLGFLSALSYTDMPYSILKHYGDEWAAMSATVTNLLYADSKK